jgi:hypothetical protein
MLKTPPASGSGGGGTRDPSSKASDRVPLPPLKGPSDGAVGAAPPGGPSDGGGACPCPWAALAERLVADVPRQPDMLAGPGPLREYQMHVSEREGSFVISGSPFPS